MLESNPLKAMISVRRLVVAVALAFLIWNVATRYRARPNEWVPSLNGAGTIINTLATIATIARVIIETRAWMILWTIIFKGNVYAAFMPS